MTSKEIIIDDEIAEARLEDISEKLNITVDELISRYIRQELHADCGYCKEKAMTKDELDERIRKNIEKDKIRGILYGIEEIDVFGFYKKTVNGNEIIEARLKDIAGELNIPVGELIEGYIKRALHRKYGYYKPERITEEELLQTNEKRLKKDRINGFIPKKHDFDKYIGIIHKEEEIQ